MLYDPIKFDNKIKLEESPWQQVLRKAADYIKRIGWVQHTGGNETVGFCAAYAIQFAAYDLSLDIEYRGRAWSDAAAAFVRYIGVKYIPDWNDNPLRTEAEVVAALLACADA